MENKVANEIILSICKICKKHKYYEPFKIYSQLIDLSTILMPEDIFYIIKMNYPSKHADQLDTQIAIKLKME